MKELKQPWVNWNSMAARIRDTALAPDDPLRNELLWTGRSGAEDFETEVSGPVLDAGTTRAFSGSAQAAG